jgi:hypothetical protein
MRPTQLPTRITHEWEKAHWLQLWVEGILENLEMFSGFCVCYRAKQRVVCNGRFRSIVRAEWHSPELGKRS